MYSNHKDRGKGLKGTWLQCKQPVFQVPVVQCWTLILTSTSTSLGKLM